MCKTIETITECLGKSIVDPYGRKIGFIVSYCSDIDGNIKTLEVNMNEIEYKELPIDRFKFTPEAIILLPEYEYRALLVENRLKFIKTRLASLEELYARKEVPSYIYEAQKKKLEEDLASIKNYAREVKDLLRTRLHEVEEQIAEIEKAISAFKASYIAGEIKEDIYFSTLDIMKKSLELFIKEKENIKKHIDKIESLEALPLSPAITQLKEGQNREQPINVVLVE